MCWQENKIYSDQCLVHEWVVLEVQKQSVYSYKDVFEPD